MTFDVIVVGARCAGAATALLLARGGARVLVLDRGQPGTDALSTHALARPAVLQLHRWGLLDDLRAAGTPRVTTSIFHYGDESVPVAIRPADGVDGLFNPRRYLLDSVLVGAARAAGAEVRHGHTVTGLLRDDDGRVRGVRVRADGGAYYTVRAPFTVGADGRGSRLARAVAAPVTNHGTGAGVITYAYWSGLARDANELYFRPGVSAGVFPTNDGLACVWAGGPAQRAGTRPVQPPTRLRKALRTAAPSLAANLEGQVPAERARSFAGLRGLLRRPWGAGWVLVGDAGYFKDPITAHGITDAFRDADLLAAALLSGGTEADLRHYEGQRDALSRSFAAVTDEIARYRWGFERLRELHLGASMATRVETEHLRRLQHVTPTTHH